MFNKQGAWTLEKVDIVESLRGCFQSGSLQRSEENHNKTGEVLNTLPLPLVTSF